MICYVLNYLQARNFEPKQPTLAIRIFDPDAKETFDGEWLNHPNAPFPSGKYIAELRFIFSDCDPDRGQKHIGQPFSANLAETLLRQVQQYQGQFEQLVIHCNAGMNRSPAVAMALDEIFGWGSHYLGPRKKVIQTYKDAQTTGNDFIYRLLWEAAERLRLK